MQALNLPALLDIPCFPSAGETSLLCRLLQGVSYLYRSKSLSVCLPYHVFPVCQAVTDRYEAAIQSSDISYMSVSTRALSQLPPVVVLSHWQGVLSSCRRSLSILCGLLAEPTLRDVACQDIKCIADIMARILTELICFEEGNLQNSSDLLHEILTCMTDTKRDINSCSLFSVMQRISAASDSYSQNTVLDIVKLLIQSTVSCCFHMEEAAGPTAVKLCDDLRHAVFGEDCPRGGVDCQFQCGIPVDDLVAPLLVNLHSSRRDDAEPARRSSLELFHTLVEVYCENSLHKPWRPLHAHDASQAEQAVASDSFLHRYLELCLDSLSESAGLKDGDERYTILADLYRLVVCSGNVARNLSPTNGNCIVSVDVEAKLLTLAYSDASNKGSGWLDFVGAFVLLSGKSLQGGGRYLSNDLVRKLVDDVVKVVKGSANDSELPCQVQCAVSSILSVTLPGMRAVLVARPLFDATACMLHSKEGSAAAVFATLQVLMRAGRCEWRDSGQALVARRNFRKSVLQQACFTANLVSTSSRDRGAGLSCVGLAHAIELFDEELTYCLAAMSAPKGSGTRKVVNKTEDLAERQCQAALLTDTVEAAILFLTTTSAYILSYCPSNVHSISVVGSALLVQVDICRVAHSLVKLLSSVLTCPSLTMINSNVGSIALILRQVTTVSIVLASYVVPDISAGPSGVDVLRAVGRALMAAASSKHLHKHAYLLIVSVVDALTWFTKRNALEQLLDSSVQSTPTNASTFREDSAAKKTLTISSADETLRETLLPGLFALLDRCVISIVLTTCCNRYSADVKPPSSKNSCFQCWTRMGVPFSRISTMYISKIINL